MDRDISIIARDYCRQSRLIRRALVGAQANTLPVAAFTIDPRSRFAAAVMDRLDGSILRYSMRLELIRLAGTLGLSRFDACLIIAQVQHRAARAPRSGPPVQQAPARTPKSWRMLPYLVAGVVELCIVAGTWAIIA